MKILYALQQFFPEGIYGTERFTFNLASSLQRAGHHVRVAAGTFAQEVPPGQPGGLFIKEYTYKGIPVTVFRSSRMKKEADLGISPDKAVKRWAQKLWEQNEFDLLHITHPMRVNSLAFAAGKKGLPYVLTLTDHFLVCYRGILLTLKGEICFGPEGGNRCLSECPIPQMERDYFQKRLAWAEEILSRAALVAAPSQFVADIFHREFPQISIKIIPYGINVRRFTRKDKFYEPGSPVTFGFMGTIGSHKGVHLLLEAFRRLDSPHCRLRIHGAPNIPSYLEELKALAAGDNRIEFCGAYSLEEDINGILNNIDVLCVPSLCHDTHPLVIQEAKAAGVPVIGSRRGGIPESVQDGVNGFLFNPDNVDNLYQIMAKIMNDPTILNILKKQITPPPLIEEEAITYERIYRGVLADSRGKAKKRRWFF